VCIPSFRANRRSLKMCSWCFKISPRVLALRGVSGWPVFVSGPMWPIRLYKQSVNHPSVLREVLTAMSMYVCWLERYRRDVHRRSASNDAFGGMRATWALSSISTRQVQPDSRLAATRASEKLPPARSREEALSRPIKANQHKPQQIWTFDASDRLTSCVVKPLLGKGRKNRTIRLRWNHTSVRDNCG
jgi:hypothetical protein